MKRYAFLCFAALFAGGCSSQKSPALADPPIITSASYQHTLYDGRRQPIDAQAAKENAPLALTYYPSEADYDADTNGFTEAPVEVGLYYVRIRRPAGNGYRHGPDIKVEYRIQPPLQPTGNE